MITAAQRGLTPVRQVLDNGAVIIAKESPATPAVTIHASFHAGTCFDPPASAGVASLRAMSQRIRASRTPSSTNCTARATRIR